MSFWFSWLAVTLVYLALAAGGGLGVYQGTFIGYLTGFFGLFAPIGIFSFLFSLGGWRIVVFFIVGTFLLCTDAATGRFAFNPAPKIFFNLAVLFLLTLFIDMILYQSWSSLTIFLEGGMNTNFSL